MDSLLAGIEIAGMGRRGVVRGPAGGVGGVTRGLPDETLGGTGGTGRSTALIGDASLGGVTGCRDPMACTEAGPEGPGMDSGQDGSSGSGLQASIGCAISCSSTLAFLSALEA